MDSLVELKDKNVDYFDRHMTYNKSNVLIDSKYRSSLLEARLFSVSLSKLSEAVEDEVGTLIVKIRASEIKELIDANNGSFYTQLENAARAMSGRRAGFSDPDNQRFIYMNIVKTAIYENGLLTIKFNEDMKPLLKGLTASYTTLSLLETLSFEKSYSLRMFEIIRSRCFTPKGMSKISHWKIEFNLAELKLMIGVVNSELDAVQNILNGSKNPDYEKAVKASPEKVYEQWSDLRKKVIEPSIKEINQKTKYNISYVPNKAGKGGKVQAITFYVDLIEEEKPVKKKPLTMEEQFDFVEELSDKLPGVKLKELSKLASSVDYDKDLIEKAIRYLNDYPFDIKNQTAFLVWAIKNDFPEVSRENKNKFADFALKQDYDFEELEEIMSR